jgi:hypothetical protein
VVIPALVGPRLDASLVIGAAGCVALAIGVTQGSAVVVPLAIALLAGAFMVAPAARGGGVSFAVAAGGAALLVIAELAYWSTQLRLPSRIAPGVMGRRVLATAILIATTLAVGLLAAALALAPVPGGLGLLAVGVGAIVVAIAVAAAVIWPSDAGGA